MSQTIKTRVVGVDIGVEFTTYAVVDIRGFIIVEDRIHTPDYPNVNDFVNMKMYVGDRTGRPLMVDRNSFRPTAWVDVSANLIQV